MKCPYCNRELEKFHNTVVCANTNDCVGCFIDAPIQVWGDLIAGKQAQSELNYYKGLNCPTVVEKQMQTITKLAKQLDVAVAALKEIVANPHGAACHNYARAKEALKEIE